MTQFGNSGNQVLPSFFVVTSSFMSTFLDAKLEKIHPPVFWKPLDPISLQEKKEISSTEHSETSLQESSDACHYTSLVYRSSADKAYRIFVDFEHQGLSHMSWKESDDLSMQRRYQTSERKEISKPKVKKKSEKPDLIRYVRVPAEKDDLTTLDSASSTNRPHTDFFHRKYLVSEWSMTKRCSSSVWSALATSTSPGWCIARSDRTCWACSIASRIYRSLRSPSGMCVPSRDQIKLHVVFSEWLIQTGTGDIRVNRRLWRHIRGTSCSSSRRWQCTRQISSAISINLSHRSETNITGRSAGYRWRSRPTRCPNRSSR